MFGWMCVERKFQVKPWISELNWQNQNITFGWGGSEREIELWS